MTLSIVILRDNSRYCYTGHEPHWLTCYLQPLPLLDLILGVKSCFPEAFCLSQMFDFPRWNFFPQISYPWTLSSSTVGTTLWWHQSTDYQILELTKSLKTLTPTHPTGLRYPASLYLNWIPKHLLGYMLTYICVFLPTNLFFFCTSTYIWLLYGAYRSTKTAYMNNLWILTDYIYVKFPI